MNYDDFVGKQVCCISRNRGTSYNGKLLRKFPDKLNGLILVIESVDKEYVFFVKEKDMESIALVISSENKETPKTKNIKRVAKMTTEFYHT